MKADITKKIFSTFLGISWLIVLFFLLYPFFKDNTTPNFWLLLILVVLPLSMLVQKLKIGSFFDFSKSDSPSHQMPTKIGQQINLSVMGQEAAKTFLESITVDLERQTKQLNSSSQNKDSKYIELNHSIDLILINLIPTIRAYYLFIMTMVQDKPFKTFDKTFNKSLGTEITIALFPEKEIDYSPVLLLIEKIQANLKSVFASATEELSLDFINIRKLIELRNSIASTHAEFKSSKETLDILSETIKSSGHLLGFLSGNWSMLRLSMKTILQSTNKPINKYSNK